MNASQVWFDNKAWASSVSYLNAINNVILRSSLQSSAGDPKKYGITAISHPMNYTNRELQDKLKYLQISTIYLYLYFTFNYSIRFSAQVGVSLLNAISVIFAMSFVPASFVIFLVEERTSKAKHLQFVAGVKPITFWSAAYTWDLVSFFFTIFKIHFHHSLFNIDF